MCSEDNGLICELWNKLVGDDIRGDMRFADCTGDPVQWDNMSECIINSMRLLMSIKSTATKHDTRPYFIYITHASVWCNIRDAYDIRGFSALA